MIVSALTINFKKLPRDTKTYRNYKKIDKQESLVYGLFGMTVDDLENYGVKKLYK